MTDDKHKDHGHGGRDDHGEHHDHEYELIPVSPLRKLEKRMENIEHQSSSFDSREFYKELVEIIRMNQQLVDELAKANDALRIELSRLPSRLEDMIGRLDELISYIKASAGEDYGPESSADAMKPLIDKMTDIIESNKKIAESNEAVQKSIEEMNSRMKKPLPPPGMMRPRRPLFPPKNI